MTIATITARIAYPANGQTTNFAIPFVFFDADELLVIERNNAGIETVKQLNTDYTVSGGNGDTGTVTATIAPPLSALWIIKRNTRRTQLVDYTPNDPFPADTHERALDRLQAQIQDSAETLERAAKLRLSSPLTSLEMPDPAALQLLRWNENANGLENSPAGALALTVKATQAQVDAGIDDGSFITPKKLAANPIALQRIPDGLLTTAKIADANITFAKLQPLSGKSLIGRSVSGAGNAEEVTPLHSLILANGSLGLANDTPAPGNGKYYGTDATGNRGWFGQKLIDRAYAEYTANADLAAIIPLDDTIPQNTEGTQIVSVSVTVTSTTQRVRTRFKGFGGVNNNQMCCALFRGGTCVNAMFVSTSGFIGVVPLFLEFEEVPGIGTYVYSIRVGPTTTGPVRLNGTSGTRYFGGAARATLIAEVIEP